MIDLNKEYFLFDGAFGTYYAEKYGGEIPCEFASVDNKDRVIAIHKEYIEAGAMAIKTNSFSANTCSLGVDFKTVEKIIKSSFEAACEAVKGTNVSAFADIGPIPVNNEEELDEYFKIVDTFLKIGAENFLLETMNDTFVFNLSEYIKEKNKDAFVIVSFGIGQDGYTIKGVPMGEISRIAENNPLDAFGFNCICGPAHLLTLVNELPPTKKILSVMPNSCYPTVSGGRTLYIDNAEYYSEKMLQIYKSGVKIIGGCCGTTPQHIKAVAEKLKFSEDFLPVTRNRKNINIKRTENAFAAKLLAGEKVIAVEIDPPLDADYSHIAEAAPYLKDSGADVLTLADSPLARPRADSVIISAKVQRENEIQTVPHLSCRDHNTIGLKSALLGASIEGIRNILIVTGDPVPSVERSEVRGVFSTNSYDLIKYVNHLNSDTFMGQEFFIGSALNVNAEKFEIELKRAIKKEENGTKFFMTQPIFSDTAANNLKIAKETLRGKILAGIMPVVSYRNAMFLNNEVPGITIPDEVVEKFQNAAEEDVINISVDFSIKMIEKINPFCDGFYLMTPLKKYKLIGEIIRRIKKEIL